MSDQLTLPYEEITKVAGRKQLRDTYTVSSKVIYRIPIADIQERPGFNKRIVYDNMEELAQSIQEHGLKDPLTVDVLPDGRVFIEKGHRRFRAIQMLIKNGVEIIDVECYPNSREVTEQNRMEDVFNSNMFSCKLHPIEQAAVVFDLKNNFGKVSNDEIGKRLNISRQKVDYLLLIGEADDQTKDEIKKGNLGITEAADLIRDRKKLQKEADKVEEDSHKTTLSPTAEPKDALAGELKELSELDKQAAQLKEEEKLANDREALLAISDEVSTLKLDKHIGKKLSASVWATEPIDFIDEATSEVVNIDKVSVIVEKDTLITDEICKLILGTPGSNKTAFVYKKGFEPVAESVITQAPEGKEKDKYDKDRPEIAQVQNIIKLADKIEAVVNKLDCPEQTKLDLAKYVQWLQKDAADLREWVHSNKKQNKMR